jgi:nitrogen-specific signal transduction histidine kinase
MSTQFDNHQPKQDNIQDNMMENNGQGFECLDSTKANHNLESNNEAVLTLLQNGMILNCNEASAKLLGCDSSKLTWQPVSRLLPQLADLALVLDEKINPYLKFLTVVGHRYEVRALNGTHFACELFFSEVEEFGRHCLRVVMQPIREGQPATLRHLRTY